MNLNKITWDYKNPPKNILWKLQRIADFFPAYGTERETINALFKHRDSLQMEKGKYKLIKIYYEILNENKK